MCLLLSKSLLEINLHTIRTSRTKVATYQSSKVLDLYLHGWSWSYRLEVYVGDLKHELEVPVGADPHQRSLRGLELDWIILVKFTTNGIFFYYKLLFDIVDCSLRIVPSRFFTLKLDFFIGFPESLYLVLFSFPLCMICLMNI